MESLYSKEVFVFYLMILMWGCVGAVVGIGFGVFVGYRNQVAAEAGVAGAIIGMVFGAWLFSQFDVPTEDTEAVAESEEISEDDGQLVGEFRCKRIPVCTVEDSGARWHPAVVTSLDGTRRSRRYLQEDLQQLIDSVERGEFESLDYCGSEGTHWFYSIRGRQWMSLGPCGEQHCGQHN